MAKRHLVRAAATSLTVLICAPAVGTAAATTAYPTNGTPTTQLVRQATDPELERQTGLRVTIDRVEPLAITPGEPLVVRGVVSNIGTQRWEDAQVYLDIEAAPATTRAGLDQFAANEQAFGTRIVAIPLFDEIGNVLVGTSKSYRLSIPYGQLPINETTGAYHVGVSVLAQNVDGRDMDADARADTVLPLLANDAGALTPTPVVTMIPLAATVRRSANGNFLDDSLALALAEGGQLRNLATFIDRAPSDSLEIVMDPALATAVEDMADGYVVQSLRENAQGKPGHEGDGQPEAKAWLDTMAQALPRQDLLLMPWGSPNTSSLGTNDMPGIVESAVRASQRYASIQRITTSVANWPYNGYSTRRGLSLARDVGTPLQVVSEASLPDLQPEEGSSYPPAQVSVPTDRGALTSLVTRTDVAGTPITTSTTALQLLQGIMAEATVRAVDGENGPTSVIAMPFGWNPGADADTLDLLTAYTFPTVEPRTAASTAQEPAATYDGRPKPPRAFTPLSDGVISAIRTLRSKGRTLTDLLTDQEQARITFDRQLAAGGSSLWRTRQTSHAVSIRRTAKAATNEYEKVTVTGPTFVALSSASGRFPLTVTNGLDVSVTVKINVRPDNPAVKIDPIDSLVLDPGQRRDIEVSTKSQGSGLTAVTVRLSTTSDRPFGEPWDFNIRATQIGVAIWVVMGIGAGILFVAAGRRIYLRVRGGTLVPRGEQPPS